MKKSNVLATKFAGVGALTLLLAASAFADNRPQDETGRVREARDGSATTRSELRTGGAARDAQDNGSQRDRQNGAYQRDTDSATRDNATATQREDRDQAYRESRDNNATRRDGSSTHGSYDRSGSNSRGGTYDRGRSEPARSYRNNERVQTQGHISRYSHERGGYRLWLDNGAYSYWVPESRWRSNWRVGIDIVLGGVFRDGTVYADVYDDPYGGGYGPGYAQQYLSGYVDRVDYRTGALLVRDDRSGRILTVDTRSIDPRYSRIDGRDLRRGDRVTFEGSWLRGGIFAADRVDSVDTGRY